jgi:hypothetical protein
MKKLIVLLFVCAALVMACGKKIMPESDANNQSNNEKEKTSKSASKNEDQNNSVSSLPSFNIKDKSVLPPPPEGVRSASLDKGKTVFVSKCGGCHALKNAGDYTSNQWNTILRNEIPKANLDSRESDQVTAYILANAKK